MKSDLFSPLAWLVGLAGMLLFPSGCAYHSSVGTGTRETASSPRFHTQEGPPQKTLEASFEGEKIRLSLSISKDCTESREEEVKVFNVDRVTVHNLALPLTLGSLMLAGGAAGIALGTEPLSRGYPMLFSSSVVLGALSLLPLIHTFVLLGRSGERIAFVRTYTRRSETLSKACRTLPLSDKSVTVRLEGSPLHQATTSAQGIFSFPVQRIQRLPSSGSLVLEVEGDDDWSWSVEDATRLLDRYWWPKTQREDTLGAYRNYLAILPFGPHSKEAQAKIDEAEDRSLYQRCRAEGTLWGLRKYLGFCKACLFRDRLQSRYPALRYLRLKLLVTGASLAKDYDLASKTDPFAVVHYGSGAILTTPMRQDDNHPTWNETVVFDYEIGQTVEMVLYDADITKHQRIGSDDFSFDYKTLYQSLFYRALLSGQRLTFQRRMDSVGSTLSFAVELTTQAVSTSHLDVPERLTAGSLIALALTAATVGYVLSKQGTASDKVSRCAAASALDKASDLFKQDSSGKQILQDASVEIIKSALLKQQPTPGRILRGVVLQQVKREVTSRDPRLEPLFDSAEFLLCVLN